MEPAPISEKKQSLLIGGKKFAIAGVAVLIIAAAAVFFLEILLATRTSAYRGCRQTNKINFPSPR